MAMRTSPQQVLAAEATAASWKFTNKYTRLALILVLANGSIAGSHEQYSFSDGLSNTSSLLPRSDLSRLSNGGLSGDGLSAPRLSKVYSDRLSGVQKHNGLSTNRLSSDTKSSRDEFGDGLSSAQQSKRLPRELPSNEEGLSSNGLSGGRLSEQRCIAEKPDEPKYFYYGDQALAISIFTTDRITHKLTSTILKIFAEEVLGYSNVTVNPLDDPKQGFDPDIQFSYISSCADIR